jgi:alpha-glucosidase
MQVRIIFCLIVGSLLPGLSVALSQDWSVTSPNGEVKLTVMLAPKDGRGETSAAKRLCYRLEHGPEGARSVVVDRSSLGLRLQGHDFAEGLQFVSAEPQKLIEEAYSLLHGKRRECHNRAYQLALTFRNAQGQPLELDLRAYDDGAAFRYRLPSGLTGTQILESEATEFAVGSKSKVWCAPNDRASTYSPAYETYYENEISPDTPSANGVGWEFPLLFRTGDGQHWGLITEAGVGTNFCGTRLGSKPLNGVYSIALPDPAEGNGQGSSQPASNLPWEMPWRVIILGRSLAPIVESTLVTDVSPPARVSDTSWIRPGRVAWSWWSDNPSPKDGVKQKKFVDLAAEMGWEYVLVDANWTVMDNGNIHDVLRYARQKGVGVLLWYNSGGPHNVVTEKPRDCLTYAPVRQFELDMLREWGVKGIKVDFFQSDKQEVIGLYQGILCDAAEKQIMVNFHGCTLPRGWERTYPHLMSMEGVRGEECYIFDDKYPERAPAQNTITPFTRNAVGPMDYTPVTFSNSRYPRLNTSVHELALAVLFESGWVHFADKAESYLSLPPAPKQFLRELPVAWDDTRFIDGYPGQWVSLARRKGETWYVVAVNGENHPRTARIQPGDWLKRGRYELTTIGDGADAHPFDCATQPWETGQTLEAKMAARGGFVAVLKRQQ